MNSTAPASWQFSTLNVFTVSVYRFAFGFRIGISSPHPNAAAKNVEFTMLR